MRIVIPDDYRRSRKMYLVNAAWERRTNGKSDRWFALVNRMIELRGVYY